jgi:hypothetical protein
MGAFRSSSPSVRLVGALIGLAIAASACSSGGGGTTAASPASPSSTTVAPSPTGASTAPSPTGGSTEQASGVDPCQLVTTPEANSLLGGSTQRTGPKSENRLLSCTWKTGGGLLVVTVAQGSEFYAPDITNPGSKPLSGVGDDAFVDVKSHTVGFIKGDTVVDLFVAFHEVSTADLEDLARMVAGRV